MKVIVYTSGGYPGVFEYVDPSGNEDAILVSPGSTYRLEIREVIRHEEHVIWQVVDAGSSAPGGVVIKKKRTSSEQTGEETSSSG